MLPPKWPRSLLLGETMAWLPPQLVNQGQNRAMDDKPHDPQDPAVVHRVQIEITWTSIFRLLLGVLLAYAAVLLWPFFKLLTLAILVAVALYPLVAWVHRRGWPRWLGLLVASTVLIVVVVGCFVIIAPMIVRQLGTLADNLPKLRDQIMAQLPATGPLHDALQHSADAGTVADSRLVLERFSAVVGTTLGGLANFIIVIGLALYLLVDGPRALRWLIVFFPATERDKISQALTQMSGLIYSYVAGQLFVSTLAATYLTIVLHFLGVPMALLLGIIAGICDILPIVGFFVAVFFAMAMGLTVSPTTALLAFVFYGAYHMFENVFILPRVYGRRLKLAKLAVPLAFVAGGLLAGVVGAIAALPIVAAYPVIERLWLARKLNPDAVKYHEGNRGPESNES